MLEIEPKSLVFRDIHIRESYTSNLVLTNTLSTHVRVTLRSSAPGRYILAPNQMNIQPGESIVVTVRLHIQSFPAYEKGVKGQEDFIQISSSFFEQKISTMFFLHKRSTITSLVSGSGEPGVGISSISQNRSTVGYDTTIGSGGHVHAMPPAPGSGSGPGPDDHRQRKFIKTMKNNASFAAAASADKRSTDHIIDELNNAVKVRDTAIEKLQATITKLEEKHPSFHDIIRDRVELERITFEEKSQKVLEILNKKDRKLENLQQQLDEQLKREEGLEEELQKLRDKQSQIFEHDLHRQQQGGNRYIEELQHRMTTLEEENTTLRRNVETLEESLNAEKLKSASRAGGGADARGDSPAITGHVNVLQDRLKMQEKELISYREQNADQVEQIEVLIAEVSKLRAEAEENKDRFEHQQQYINNMTAAQNAEAEDKVRIEHLQYQVSTLEEEVKSSNDRYADIYNYNKMLELQLEDSAKELEQSAAQANAPRDLDTSGMNTDSLLSLYKDRAVRAEADLNHLRDIYEQAQATERDSAKDLAEFEARNKALVEKEFALQKRIEAFRSQEILLDEKTVTLKHIMSTSGLDDRDKENILCALDNKGDVAEARIPDLGKKSLNENFAAPTLEDANSWWSYVWHEMRKGSQNQQLYGGNRSVKKNFEESSEDSESDIQIHDNGDPLGIWSDIVVEDLESSGKEEVKDNEAIVHRKRSITKQFLQRKNAQIEKLRNVVRSSAIEVTTLRQAKLLTLMQHKQAISSAEEKLELAKREISKLQAYNRNHKGDKEIKIAEMTATIKSLTARSDLHSELAIAHQDLESERLVVCSLRSDIESYREMLENEKEKVAALRRENDKVQIALTASQIAESLLSVPGLNPGALIELFSGRLMWLQTELNKARSAASSLSMLNQGGNLSKTAGVKSHLSPLTPSTSSPSTTPSVGKSKHIDFQDNLSFREPEHWQKELLQRATTPDKLLSGLDTVLLARRAADQSETIESLNNQIKELESALTSATVRDNMIGISTSVTIGEGDEHLDRHGEQARIEKNAAVRRLELCQENLKQSEDEVETLRARVVFAESMLSDFKKKMNEYSVHHCKPCVSCCKRIEKRLDGSPVDDSSGVDDASEVENDSLMVLLEQPSDDKNVSKCSKCDSVHHLLQERTTQLKIMMETMEALQMGDVKHLKSTAASNTSASAGVESSSLEDIMAQLDAGSVSRDDAKLEHLLQNAGNATRKNGTPNTGQLPWEARALVKRIVELTADCSAQCSALAMAERQMKQLESDKCTYLKEFNKLNKKTKQLEANALLLNKKYSSALLNLNRVEKLRSEEKNGLEVRLEELIRVVRKNENECDELRVSNEEMKQQMDLADRSAFQKWFTEVVVVSSHETNGTATGQLADAGCNSPGPAKSTGNGSAFNSIDDIKDANLTGGSDSSVRNLVVTLLVQWREQAGFYPRGATGPISKAEQRFLQRLTDLVMDSHSRASQCEKESLRAERERLTMDRKLTTVQKRLETAMLHLFQYRCRAEAAERLGVAASRLKLRTEGTLASVMRKGTRRLSSDLTTITSKFLKERAANSTLEVELKYTNIANKELKSQLAEMEAKGSLYVQAREAALNCVDGKIRDGEKNLQQWIKTEIPRLMTGLPISEDDYCDYDIGDALSALDIDGNEYDNFYGSKWKENRGGGEFDSPHGHSSQSQQRHFALAQTLCTSKATQNKLEITVHTLQDKNASLRERVMELTGVISRWKEDFEGKGCHASIDLSEPEDVPANTRALQEAHENEIALRNLTEQQRSKIIELEEALVVSLGQITHVEERESGLRDLLDVLRRGESDLKHRAAVQVSRVKQEGEERHLLELRDMREAYEQEKLALMRELEAVSAALMKANTRPIEGEVLPHKWLNGESGIKAQDRYSSGCSEHDGHYVNSRDDHSNRLVQSHQASATPIKNGIDVSPLSKSSDGTHHSNGMTDNERQRSSQRTHIPNNHDRDTINITDHDIGVSEQNHFVKEGINSKLSSRVEFASETGSTEDFSDLMLSPSSEQERSPMNDARTKQSDSDHCPDRVSAQRGVGNDSIISDVSFPSHLDKVPNRSKSPACHPPVLEGDSDREEELTHEYLTYAVRELKRRLSVEKDRARQARDQVSELEQLLETQREAFQRHLDLERDIAENMSPNATMSSKSSSTSGPNNAQGSQNNNMTWSSTGTSSSSFQSPGSMPSTPFANMAPRFPLQDTSMTFHSSSPNISTPAQPFPLQQHRPHQDDFSSSYESLRSGEHIQNDMQQHQQQHHHHHLDEEHPPNSSQYQSNQQSPFHQHSPNQIQQPIQQQGSGRLENHEQRLHSSLPRSSTPPVVKEVAAEDPALWPPLASMAHQLQQVLLEAKDHVQTIASERGNTSSDASSLEGNSNQEGQAKPSYTYMKGALYKNQLLSLLHEASVISERLHRSSKNPSIEEKYIQKTLDVDSAEEPPFYLSPGKGSASALGQELNGVLDRVNTLEDIFSGEGDGESLGGRIPEKHLYLLRELRGRVVYLEEVMHAELTQRQAEWERDKETLQRQVEEYRREAESMSELSNDGVDMIKKRYENALKDAQDALVDQTASFTKQIEYLELELVRSKEQHKVAPRVSYSLPADALPSGDMEGHLHMQKLLDSAVDDSDKYRNQLKEVHEKHTREVQQLREHFEKYRKAQEQIVTSLEQQVAQAEQQGRMDRIMHAASTNAEGGKLDRGEVFSVGGDSQDTFSDIFGHESVTPLEADSVLRETAYRLRCKQAELKAVLRALSVAGAATANEEGKVVDSKDKSASEDLLEARVEAAGKEVQHLYRLLERERKHSGSTHKIVTFSESVLLDQQRNDLEDSRESVTVASQTSSTNTATGTKSSAKKSSSSKTDMLLSTRKAFAQEIDDLKHKKRNLEEDALSHKSEVAKLKHFIGDLKDQVASLREDNSRKSKLLSAIRASKSSDDNALEQWRHEVSESEEKLKRATRSIASKEGVIRDLKNKVESLEGKLKEKTKQLAEAGGEGGGEQSKSWSLNELKSRYKASELEKARMKSRLTASKEKITELERQLKTLESAATKRKVLEDKTEAMKLALARKDALLKSHKDQMEQLRVDLLSLQEISSSRKADSDRHLKTTQRQQEAAEARCQELLKEKDNLRDRYEAEVRKLNEESVYLRGLLSETTLELENRFHHDLSDTTTRPHHSPPPSPPRKESSQVATSDSKYGHSVSDQGPRRSQELRQLDRGTDRHDKGHNRNRDRTFSRDRSESDTSKGNVHHTSDRISVNELNEIMEELSGDTSGLLGGTRQGKESVHHDQSSRRSQSRRYTTGNAMASSDSDDENKEHHQEYRSSHTSTQKHGHRHSDSSTQRDHRVRSVTRGVSMTSRLLQEDQAELSDDTYDHKSGSRKTSRAQEGHLQASYKHDVRNQRGGNQHSPESDQNSTDSDVLSVENRLKGLIQAALRED